MKKPPQTGPIIGPVEPSQPNQPSIDPLAVMAEQARARLQAKFDFYRSYGIQARASRNSAGGWLIKVTSSLNAARPLAAAIPGQMDYATLDLLSRTILDSFECGQAIGSQQTKEAIKARLGQIVDGLSDY